MTWKKEQIDAQKCRSAYEVTLSALVDPDDENPGYRLGDSYSEKEWQQTRSGLVKEEGLNYAEADEVMKALRKQFAAAPAPAASESVAAVSPPALVAASDFDHDWVPDPELPGYEMDRNGQLRVSIPGKGRLLGRILTLQKEWGRQRTGKGKYNPNGKPYPRLYYHVTVDGKDRKEPFWKVAMRRYRYDRERDPRFAHRTSSKVTGLPLQADTENVG